MKRILPLLAAYAALAFISACSSTTNEDTPGASTPSESEAPTAVEIEAAASRLTDACNQWAFTRDTIDSFGPADPTSEVLEVGIQLTFLQEMAADTDIRQAVFAFTMALWNRDQHQQETYRWQLNEICDSFGENDSQTPVRAIESPNAD